MKSSDPYYDSGYHATHHRELISGNEYFSARAEVQARFYFSVTERQKHIFEYGCGIGQGIVVLPDAWGWDVSAEARDVCRKRNLRIFDDLAAVPKGEWDIVFCRHVLEHLEQPLDNLKCMRELLAPDGELYLILPKEDHYLPKIAPDVNQHLFAWNFQTVNNLLFRAGLKPYRNEYRYMLGWHAFLPIRRILGKEIYFQLTRLGGLLRRNGELVVRARLA
jgi:SAM-dependent methyltransferase